MKIDKNKICLLGKLQLHLIPTTMIMMRKILSFAISIEIGLVWSSCVVKLLQDFTATVKIVVRLLLFKQNAYMNSSALNILVYYIYCKLVIDNL